MDHLSDILGTQGQPSDKLATIYIVRHGATRLNNQTDTSVDRIRGWKDIPLVDEGRKEAREAGLKLKGKNIGAIVCSDLCRAHETANIIGKIINIAPEPSQNLRPWNLGKLQGTTTKEALPQIAEYARKKPDEPVPEGESFNQFKDRTFKGFAEAVASHPGQIVLIVTHHRDERLIEAWDKAGQPEDHSIDLKTFLQKGDPPGGIKVLHLSEAALKGNGKTMANSSGGGGNQMTVGRTPMKYSTGQTQWSDDEVASLQKSSSRPIVDAASPRQQFMDKIAQGPKPAMRDTLAHGRAIAGAKALHAVGHITTQQRDKHIAKSQKAISGARKPFGAFAP